MMLLTRWVVMVAVLMLAQVAQAGEKDIFGRDVPVIRNHPLLVLYANQATKDAVDAPMTELSVKLYDLQPIVFIRVDLRGVPSIFEGIARRIMRGSFEDGLKRYRERCKELKLEPTKDDDKGLYFIADSYGKPHQELGLASGFKEAMAVAFDGNGKEIARGAFPRQMAEIEAAIRKAYAKVPAAVGQ